MSLKSIIPWTREDQPLARSGDDPLTHLQRQMNNLFDSFLGRASADIWGNGAGEFMPQIDLGATEKEVRLTAELPGLEITSCPWRTGSSVR